MGKVIDRFLFGSPKATGHEKYTVLDTKTGATYEFITDERSFVNVDTGAKMPFALAVTLSYALMENIIANDDDR